MQRKKFWLHKTTICTEHWDTLIEQSVIPSQASLCYNKSCCDVLLFSTLTIKICNNMMLAHPIIYCQIHYQEPKFKKLFYAACLPLVLSILQCAIYKLNACDQAPHGLVNIDKFFSLYQPMFLICLNKHCWTLQIILNILWHSPPTYFKFSEKL